MIRKSCILFVILALGFVLCLTNGFADVWAEFTEAIRVAEEMRSAANGFVADRPGDIQGTPEFQKVPENIIGTASTTPPAQMYWTIAKAGASAIQRANLDGSQVEDLVTTGLSLPGGIAVDLAGGKMYWTDWGLDAIYRADLDGSNVEPLITGSTPAHGVSLWTQQAAKCLDDRFYWRVDGEIQCANLDGSNVQTLVTGLYWPQYITLDVAGGKMYWTVAEAGASAIQRADLNGANVENLVTTELRLPGASPWTWQAAKCTGQTGARTHLPC